LTGELAVADAHPLGAAPFTRPDYLRKLATLAAGVVDEAELDRFAELAERLGELAPDELGGLTVVAGHLPGAGPDARGGPGDGRGGPPVDRGGPGDGRGGPPVDRGGPGDGRGGLPVHRGIF
jgi:hypothetical protein